jgi:hypothetical protein
MVRQIRIYYEGDDQLREGFNTLFQEIRNRARGWSIRFIAGESTPEQDYLTGCRKHRDAVNLLLRDSEGPDDGHLFENLCERLDSNERESVFWMVQLMEAWFLADTAKVAEYYGIEEETLRGNPSVEQIPKDDVLDRLDAASRNSNKGTYRRHKAKHGRDLLCLIRLHFVKERSKHCQRLCDKLESLI